MNIDIKDTLDKIELTEERINKMEEKLLREKRKMEEENIFRKKSRFKKVLPIAAALTLVVSSTIMAYKGINLNFLEYLRNKNVVSENLIGNLNIDEYIHNIDQEILGDKGNLFIDQAIMDKETVFIYMTLESKEKFSYLEDEYYSFKADEYDKKWFSSDADERKKLMDDFENGDKSIIEEGSSVKVNGEDLDLIKGNPRLIGLEGNKINLVLSYDISDYMDNVRGFAGAEFDLDFKDFGYYKTYEIKADDGDMVRLVSDEFLPVIVGNWVSNFKLGDKLLPSENYKIDKKIDFINKDGKKISSLIEEVEISNLSIKAKLQAEKETDVDIMADLIFENIDKEENSGDLKLIKRNGQVVETKMIRSGMLTSSEDGQVEIKRSFTSPINLKEIESIIIWGQEVDLR